MYPRSGNTYSAIIDHTYIRATSMVSVIVTWNMHFVSGFGESEKNLFCKFYQASLDTNYLQQFVRYNL